MNRVLLSQIEQLKCNFCTQWFSVTSDFAFLQKHSINACNKCFTNFHFTIVDPTNYQIYQIMLVRTGVQIISKHQKLNQLLQTTLKWHQDSGNLIPQFASLLRNQDNCNTDNRAQISIHTQTVIDQASQIFYKLVTGLSKTWNEMIDNIKSGTTKFDQQKQNIIKIITDRYYNFIKDPSAVLSNDRIQKVNNELKNISEKVQKMNVNYFTNKIKQFMSKFLGIELTGQTLNKQNITPNKMNLKNIRERLMKTNKYGNELKVSDSNIQDRLKSSQKRTSQYSSDKHITEQIHSKNTSIQKNNQKTPRSYVYLPAEDSDKHPSPFDQDRQKIIKLLKQPTQFTTYMAVEPQKVDNGLDRPYGEKCLIEYQVQLKQKTSITENICELINQNLSKANLLCYLKSIEWQENISIIRFVKVNLHDASFDNLLNWLRDKDNVEVLVLTNNKLTELSVDALCTFCRRHANLELKRVYLGNNHIRPSKVKKIVETLRQLGVTVHI